MRQLPAQSSSPAPRDAAAASRKVVYAAIAGNLLVAATKAVAAVLTGSSAMLSETIHSIVDTGNELLLLHGMRRARREPDLVHPLGYGRELYFWSFVVALLVFALGGGVSFYEGIVHLRHPEPIEDPRISYAVLAFCFLFEGYSWTVAWREFRAAKGSRRTWEAIKRSKDPPQFMVLLEDSAALLGILIAAAGTAASDLGGDPRYDGIASLAIGLLLAGVAALLARESKGLLIGERADPEVNKAIECIASRIDGVVAVNGVLTTQLSPAQVVAAVSIEFDPGLKVEAVEAIVARMEEEARAERPEISSLFVKPQPQSRFEAAHRRRRAAIRGD